MDKLHVLSNEPLSCHAFNKDASLMAICTSGTSIYIYKCPKLPEEKFKEIAVLQKHTTQITGIDWAPTSNRIVSCAADRNAYVWTLENGGLWKPTLVILHMNRAVTCVMWSPAENKFAVGSGSRCMAVCFFEEDRDWWSSRHIKKTIRSTVTCVAWHPNNVVVACGSMEFRVRVYGAAMKTAGDPKAGPCNWGPKTSTGLLMFDVNNGSGGWIHALAFSPDGDRLIWCAHDSSISVAHATGPGSAPVVTTIRLDYLPYLSAVWMTPSLVVCAGHDCLPMLFAVGDEGMHFLAKMDGRGKRLPNSDGKQNDSPQSGSLIARRKFQNIDQFNLYQETEPGTDGPNSVHQNIVREIRKVPLKKLHFSTISHDGSIMFWDLGDLSHKLGNLSIE